MGKALRISELKLRLRRVAADSPIPPTGFTGPGRRSKSGPAPAPINAKQQAIVSAATQLMSALGRVLARVNFIEAPTQRILDQTIKSSQGLEDPQLAQKTQAKFQRIFGDMFSAIELIRTQVNPILREVTSVQEESKTLNANGAKQIVDALSAALPVVRSAFKSLDPTAHESAIEMEMQKQGHFLKQIKTFLSQRGAESPEVQQKLQLAAKGAELYLENLRTLVDPEYADRIQINIERALTQDLPDVIKSAKTLAKEFGAVEKAASVRQSQKRLQTVAKRIVLLAYLRSKSL